MTTFLSLLCVFRRPFTGRLRYSFMFTLLYSYHTLVHLIVIFFFFCFFFFLVFILFVICMSTFIVGENVKTCSFFFHLNSVLWLLILAKAYNTIYYRLCCIFMFKIFLPWITFYYWCSELEHEFTLNFEKFTRQNGTHHGVQIISRQHIHFYSFNKRIFQDLNWNKRQKCVFAPVDFFFILLLCLNIQNPTTREILEFDIFIGFQH